MKRLNNYINEKLNIGKLTKPQYTCQPKDKDELNAILKKRLAKDKDTNLNDIDVSKITDMSWLFYNLDPHNIDISQWNVSNVTNMTHMFKYCKHFNCDLGDWDVSNVEDMSNMFYCCENFKGEGLEYWNVSCVKNMEFMFSYCKNFNYFLGDWDISNITNMEYMFYGCTNFEGNGLENWNVSKNKTKTKQMFDEYSPKINIPKWYKS